MLKLKLKYSISRKSLRKMSTRQQSRVMSEIRKNLRLQNYSKINSKSNIIIKESINKNNIQSTTNKSIAKCSNVTNNSIDNVCANESIVECSNVTNNSIDNVCAIRHDINTDSDKSSVSSSCFSFADINNDNFNTLLSFRERLATCFVNNNITHTQSNNILSLLRYTFLF